MARRWHPPPDKNVLNDNSQELKREIRKIKEEHFNSFINNLASDIKTEYSLWKDPKKLKSSIILISPVRKRKIRWAKNYQLEAVLFAEQRGVSTIRMIQQPF